MKKETYFKKADELYDTIIPTQKKIREYCETYIRMFLKGKGSVDFSQCEDGCVTVTYDGGRHPEYASNASSLVSGLHLGKNGDIFLHIEETDEYPIDNIDWDEVYDVAEFIQDYIDK